MLDASFFRFGRLPPDIEVKNVSILQFPKGKLPSPEIVLHQASIVYPCIYSALTVQPAQGGPKNADIKEHNEGIQGYHSLRRNEEKNSQRPGTPLYQKEEADIRHVGIIDIEPFSDNHTERA